VIDVLIRVGAFAGQGVENKISKAGYKRAKSYCEGIDDPSECLDTGKVVKKEVDEDFTCRWGRKIKKIVSGSIKAVPARAFWKDGCYIWVAENTTLISE